MRPPQITLWTPNANLKVTVTFFAFAEVRRIARQAECKCTEERVGLFSKEFTVTGGREEMQTFCDIAWYSPDIGPAFQRELIGTMI